MTGMADNASPCQRHCQHPGADSGACHDKNTAQSSVFHAFYYPGNKER